MHSTDPLLARERARRQAIWRLDSLAPGDPRAKPILQCLDDLDQRDQVEPLALVSGDQDLRQLKELPSEAHRVGYQIVRLEHIPEPWRTRFAVAVTGSARVAEGYYHHDWLEFLAHWSKENDHIERHRQAYAKG